MGEDRWDRIERDAVVSRAGIQWMRENGHWYSAAIVDDLVSTMADVGVTVERPPNDLWLESVRYFV